jgi:hypothetical protein
MLDETTSTGDRAAPPLPVATANPSPDPAHRCNRLNEAVPAFPPGPEEELAMEEARWLLQQLIEDPEWGRGNLDPGARIGDEEWKDWEARAQWDRQRSSLG